MSIRKQDIIEFCKNHGVTLDKKYVNSYFSVEFNINYPNIFTVIGKDLKTEITVILYYGSDIDVAITIFNRCENLHMTLGAYKNVLDELRTREMYQLKYNDLF